MRGAVNKLVIGTAQFGQDYGITNVNGKVTEEEVVSILKKARANGVATLDTASSYGNSECILGNAGVNGIDIITKLPSFEGVTLDFDKFCGRALECSLSNLKVSSVNTILLHRPEELLGIHGDAIFNALLGLKDKGLTQKIGISIYSPDILDDIFDKYQFDVVQVPLNIFDRRIITSGWLQTLAESGVSVIARSVFLQGILLSNFNDLPSYFHNWASNFEAWTDFYQRNCLSALEASLQFVAQVPEIEKIIIGVESERQFSEIIKALESPIEIESNYLAANDIGLISPIHWSL